MNNKLKVGQYFYGKVIEDIAVYYVKDYSELLSSEIIENLNVPRIILEEYDLTIYNNEDYSIWLKLDNSWYAIYELDVSRNSCIWLCKYDSLGKPIWVFKPIQVNSGGQNGADLAGISAAYDLGFPTGGWCPKGCKVCNYKGEDDTNSELITKYGLREHESRFYNPRTILNVRENHGTVLFGYMESPGSKLTIGTCEKENKPYIINPDSTTLLNWVIVNNISRLNVAGNRVSKFNPDIFKNTYKTVSEFLKLYSKGYLFKSE